jgi:hypothetical protein
MRLDKIDPMADLDMILDWSKGTVFLLKVKYCDQYFVSLTNTVNFGSLVEAKIFESKEELELQFQRIPIEFSRGNVWEVLKLTLEDL